MNDTTVTAISTGVKFTYQTRNGISTFTGDANRLLWCACANMPWNSIASTPYLTSNALAASPTWTALSAPANYHACAISGDAGNVFYFWGGNYGADAAVGYSVDGGATIIDQSGNLSSFSPGKVTMLVGW